MDSLELPVNVDILHTTPERMAKLPAITSLDSFEGGMRGSSLHPEGLFSTELFGRPGSDTRMIQFARIDTKLSVIHPFIYTVLGKLRGLYKDIIEGRVYAIFNEETKDFDPSNVLEGSTGYSFFVRHLPYLELKLTDSMRREIDVELIDKVRKNGVVLTNSVVVIPAGLRDIYVERDGRVKEDEVNTKYRSLLSSANALPERGDWEDALFDTTRLSMQRAFNAIFEYLWNIFEGKRGFMANRYYSRGVENGTRNVLTSMNTRVDTLGQKEGPKLNHTVVGLFQAMKALLPVATHGIMNGWVAQAFSAGDGSAYLVNPTTMKREIVRVGRKEYDRFNTSVGINKIINTYFDRAVRHQPVMIGEHFIGLVYKGKEGDKKVFKFFNDIDELPEDLDRRDVKPITWCELLYTSLYRRWNLYPLQFTRYPVAGLGSVYPSFFYVKTTTTGERRFELDDEWKIKVFHDGNDIDSAYEYPKSDIENFVETASPHPSRLAGLTADFDGDTGSQNGFYTEEAIEEINNFLGSAKAYLNPNGGLLNSPMIDTTERALVGLMSN